MNYNSEVMANKHFNHM